MRTRIFVASLTLTFIFSHHLHPCTTALISGKATKDGRPLLLKNRDADELQNKIVYFYDGKFRYVGLVNASDSLGKEVWGGHNSAGFAIINSASYNLKASNDTTKIKDREGIIMKLALQYCATLKDFERLLDTLPKPLGIEANFGVIDAFGGGAYYETDNFAYKKYDVNDPAIAPDGFLIRTNHSCSGDPDKGAGHIRFDSATEMFSAYFIKKNLTHHFLIADLPRNLKHSLTKTDLSQVMPKDTNDTHFVWFQDYIPRIYTSAAIVIQGVEPSESPDLTTLWTVLGFPLTSVVIPVWLTPDGALPTVLTENEKHVAPLCDMALELKKKMCPPRHGIGEKYLNVAFLQNKKKTGIRQRLIPTENEIMKRGESLLNGWRKSGFNADEAKEFYKWVDIFVTERVGSLL